MKYARFEELPVWKAAIELALQLCAFAGQHRLPAGLRDQLERAVVSISNNIAEGFERGTTSELLTFLYTARGSAGEVRSMLCLLEGLPGLGDFRSEISDLRSEAEGIGRQLRAWAASLQESPIRGQRHLTEAARRKAQEDHKAEEFLAYAAEVLRRGREEKAHE